jgi:hypothetical protein
MTAVIVVGGRFLLANGRLLTATPGEAAMPPPTLTALNLIDYYAKDASARPVVQRKAGLDTADIPVLATFAGGDPSTVQACVIRASNNSIVKDWASLEDMTTDGDKLLGWLPGVQIGEDYLLRIRDGAQPTNTALGNLNGSTRWGVGVWVVIVAQSNGIGTMAAGSYNEIVAGTSQTEDAYWLSGQVAGAPFGSYGFHRPAASNGTGSEITSTSGGVYKTMRILAKALEAKYGFRVPVAVLPWGFSNHSITRFLPGGDKYLGLFNTGTTGGSIGLRSQANYCAGDIEGVVFHQGEADTATARAARVEQLKALYQAFLDYVAPFGRTAEHLFFLPAVLGIIGSSVYGGLENIRAAVMDLEDYAKENNRWPRVRIGWNCIDLNAADPNDGNPDTIHIQDAPGGNQYRRWSLMRMLQSVKYQLGCATHDGVGPRIASVARSGLVVTVTITHNGGTALAVRNSSAAITGWVANTAADFSGTNYTPTVAIASANTVTLTFASGTPFPLYVKHCGGRLGQANSYFPDISNLIYDNAAYPTGVHVSEQFTGRPLLPTKDAIEVV